MTRSIVLALTLAAAALALSHLATARANEEVAPLRFGWPVPSTVKVTHKKTSDGHIATTRLVVSLTKAQGGDILVRISGVELVELDGKPASDPALAKIVARMQALQSSQPDLLLGADGRIKDVVGIDRAIEATFAGIEAQATPEEKAALAKKRELLATPAAKEAMRRDARAFWDVWVADWIGLTVSAREPLLTTHGIWGPDLVLYQAPSRVALTPAENGHARLVRTTVLEGAQARQALDSWLAQMAQATKDAPPEGFFTAVESSERLLLVTDPATLRPDTVIREVQNAIRRKDGKDKESVERHEYQFDWSGAPPK